MALRGWLGGLRLLGRFISLYVLVEISLEKTRPRVRHYLVIQALSRGHFLTLTLETLDTLLFGSRVWFCCCGRTCS